MSLQEIYNSLEKCLKILDNNKINDITKINLEILIEEYKEKMRSEVLDTLDNLDNVKVEELKELQSLTSQVKTEIKNEKQRVALVKKIIGIAQKGLALV